MGAQALEILFVSGPDVETLGLDAADVLDVVEDAVRAQGEGKVTLDERVQHVPESSFPGHFNVLRATVWPLGATGVKVVGDFLENYTRGLPSELALITLYDPRTGVPLAIVDGTKITDRRTGALTALGARELARPESTVLAHIGSRGTAFSNVELLDRLFGFDEIRVTSRRPESREAFGARLEAALDKAVRVTDTIEEAVTGADIVVEATRLSEPEPILRTRWLDACSLLIPYGTKSALELDVLGRWTRWSWTTGRSAGEMTSSARSDRMSAPGSSPRSRCTPSSERSSWAQDRPRAGRRADSLLAPRPRHDRRCPCAHALAESSRARHGHASAVPLMVELDRWDGLDLATYRRIVLDGEPIAVSESLLEHVGQRRDALLRHLETGVAAYGVTTGLGYLASKTIGDDDQAALQRSLLTARASGLGSPLPGDVVRGAMLLRLVGFLSGLPVSTPELCRFLADRLNEGWSPVVPRGPYGASGEIAPLAHLFQTFIGEGFVELDGERVTAREAFARVGPNRTTRRSRRESRS